jgi:serine/threonine-protein kinase
MHGAFAGRGDIEARFRREAQAVAAIKHEGIVSIFDFASAGAGEPGYIVTEIVEGPTLRALADRNGGKLLPEMAIPIAARVASALAAAHARGIVHRDLKPDNVFLVPVEGRATALAKILDFGISKAKWSRGATDREICGTPQYMAPEQAEGRVGDVDALTDQYALAVITLELLTGTNPFAADTIEATFARIRDVIVLATGLPEAVDSVLARALSKEKTERFPSVTAFAEALRAAAVVPAAEPAAATVAERRPAALVKRARRAGREWRLGFAAAAAIAITSLVGTGAANRAPVAVDATIAGLPARESVTTESVAPLAAPTPAPVVAEEARLPARRARAARPSRDDRPLRTIPVGPVRRPAPPKLGPDEDATMPPSEL